MSVCAYINFTSAPSVLRYLADPMYGHPYEPYEVQKTFMTDLYDELNKKTPISLFESPTGTGKTLSLLCPSVSWLRDTAKRELDAELAKIDASQGPEWMRNRAKQLKIDQYEQQLRASSQFSGEPNPKRAKTDSSVPLSITPSTEAIPPKGRIIFASRTHSQLAQVASALRQLQVDPLPRYVQLGSRQQLCVNKEVNKLKSAQLINDRCAELQKVNQCGYRHNLDPLKAKIQHEILDIEELVKEGKTSHSCAYYAARESADYVEVVALPYALLLVAKTRDALHLDLHNSVVIIDEAHNLIDALSSLHSQTLTQNHLKRAHLGLQVYLERVGARLSPLNRRSVMQISRLVESLNMVFENIPKDAKPGTPVDASKLLAAKNADTLDVPALAQFTNDTKLVFKVDSYANSTIGSNEHKNPDSSSLSSNTTTNTLGTILDFVLTSMDPLAEGKLFIDSEENNTKVLRYLVLDSSSSFKEIVDQADAVVLAGGTMEPTAEFHHRLFPYTDELAVHTFGHIVPKSQLLVLPVGNGMKFTFAERGNKYVVERLGNTLIDIASEVPHGMVVFFPGYAYLAQVVAQWKHSNIWDRLSQIKSVFAESKASDLDVFTKFSTLAQKTPGKGAILLAVVGGRLSEGINFSDDIARAVVMIGVPYPNAFSAEMVAKRTHIEKSAMNRGRSSVEAKEEARQYYENLAMRQVNQSVGRAIRHINDYAALYLIDERFSTPGIQSKLSKWVRDSIVENKNLKQQTHEFFQRNTRK